MSAPVRWHPLELFDQRFRANLEALRARDIALAERLCGVGPPRAYYIAAEGEQVYLGRQGAGGIEVVPNPVPPAHARELTGKLFQSGVVEFPVVIGGLGYGWLWDRMARLACKVSAAPGHRPPVYLLCGDIERLCAVLHVLDLRELLADQRFLIFVGADAAGQLRQALIDCPSLPLPAACIRIEQDLWTEDFSALLKGVTDARAAQGNELKERLEALYPIHAPVDWAERLRSGRLRVLGITSRYTTFLQYSMRDWLAAFEAMGHETRLLIEPADHLMLGPIGYARGVLEFRPDLIVAIDHFRGELPLLPRAVPCVMWVQDRLPNIFNPAAGLAQGRLDYVLGYSRMECTCELNYPATRFMSAAVGVNESRFAPIPLSESERAQFECDVSFISNASVPADVLIRQEIERTSAPEIKRLLADCFERLRAVYDQGDSLTEPARIAALLNTSMTDLGIRLEDPAQLLDLFVQRINNALFRHQSLQWLSELGANVHLYGNGWEAHPMLERFARGVADNQKTLPLIYRASRICLQVTPFGAAHQRLLDGLAAGAFFLLRHTDGEDYDRISRKLWTWCEARQVFTGADLVRRATPQVTGWLTQLAILTGNHPLADPQRFLSGVADAAAAGFSRSAATLFDEFDRVAFRNRQELHRRVTHFLQHPDERREISQAMRQRVLDRLTYRAVTQRLLRFMADDLSSAATEALAA